METRRVNIPCGHPTNIPIKVHVPRIIPNRIPINPPPQLLMIKPIPIQLQPGLRVSSSSGKAKLATNCTHVVRNGQEIEVQHGCLPIRGIRVAFFYGPSVIHHRRDIKIGVLQVIMFGDVLAVGVFVVVAHRDRIDVLRVVNILVDPVNPVQISSLAGWPLKNDFAILLARVDLFAGNA